MAKERKKTEIKKAITSVEPKKREIPIVLPKIIIEEEVKETKPKKTDKYVRLALDADIEEKKSFNSKVEKGEITLAYYAIDNDKGYHYYIVNKK